MEPPHSQQTHTTLYTAIQQIPQCYLSAFSAAEKTSYDLSYAWFSNYSETALKPGEQILFSVAENTSAFVILPLIIRTHQNHSVTIEGLSNYFTSLYAPIGPGNCDIALLKASVSAVLEKYQPPVWLNFVAMDNQAKSFKALKNALSQLGLWTFDYFNFGNWYLPCLGISFDGYFQSLPSRVKNTVKRKRKQFLTLPNTKLKLVTGGEELEQFIHQWNQVYQASWKNPEELVDFMPGLLRLCAEQGWLRLAFAYLDDIPIAAQFWIVCHGKASIYKLAYDENYAQYSAGTLLTEFLIRQVLEIDQVEEIDYLVGDDTYKKDWMTQRRERFAIIAYNPKTLRGFYGAALQYASHVKNKLIQIFKT